MKRIWAPLDIHGLRLYKVHKYFPGHPDMNDEYIVAADSPSNAAQVLKESYPVDSSQDAPYYRGDALKVFQPESWVMGSAPDPNLDNCRHTITSLISSGRFAGDTGTGHETITVCMNCGLIHIIGDRNGEHFEISIHIVLTEQAEAIRRWVDYVNGVEK